jgi:hypothetical protein
MRIIGSITKPLPGFEVYSNAGLNAPAHACGHSCKLHNHTISLSSANFVVCAVGFLNICTIRLRRLLLDASLSFESGVVSELHYLL